MLAAALDLTGIGIIGGTAAAIATAVATLRTIGPDRDKKLMENFERKILASEGETEIWKRRALDCEQQAREVQQARDRNFAQAEREGDQRAIDFRQRVADDKQARSHDADLRGRDDRDARAEDQDRRESDG